MNYAKQGWQAEYSKRVSLRHLDDGGFRFAIPAAPGHVNYVMTREFYPLSGIRTLTLRFRIAGSESMEFTEDVGENDPGTMLPSVGVVLSKATQDGRWFSRHRIALAKGSHGARLVLDEPDEWGGVWGENGTQGDRFARFRLGHAQIGFAFGGGNDYGHGVRMRKGRARFVLETFLGK